MTKLFGHFHKISFITLPTKGYPYRQNCWFLTVPNHLQRLYKNLITRLNADLQPNSHGRIDSLKDFTVLSVALASFPLTECIPTLDEIGTEETDADSGLARN